MRDASTQTCPLIQIACIATRHSKSGKTFLASANIEPVSESASLYFKQVMADSSIYATFVEFLGNSFFAPAEESADESFYTVRNWTRLEANTAADADDLNKLGSEVNFPIKYVHVKLDFNVPHIDKTTVQSITALHAARVCRSLFPNRRCEFSSYFCEVGFSKCSGQKMFLDSTERPIFDLFS